MSKTSSCHASSSEERFVYKSLIPCLNLNLLWLCDVSENQHLIKMGKSLRSKRMRANRIRKRTVNRPKELKKLKEALSFEYNEQTEHAHLSIFNDSKS